MPNLRNAYKALRQSEKRAERNLMMKSDIKTALKKTRKAIDAKSPEIDKLIQDVQKQIDKAVKKNIFKKNTGARKLSRLMSYYHKGGKQAIEAALPKGPLRDKAEK